MRLKELKSRVAPYSRRMKPWAAALVALLLAGPLHAARAQTPAPSNVSISWLTGSIYLVEDEAFDIMTNSLVYVGRSQVTVIGASWTPETAKLVADQIKQITPLPITEVIDTSPDPEWSGGNGYWKTVGAKVLAIEITARLLQNTWRTTVADFRQSHPSYPDEPPVLPTEVHSGDFQLQDGDIRCFYLGPSHTAGDIFVYFPKERVLDAGSILKEHLGNMAKADVKAYPLTLHRLEALRLDTNMIVSGHWSPVHGPDLIEHYLELLRENAAQSQKL
jgi:metallo-beta-lactamase class B